MTNPNDEIRAQILRYFYDRNDRATSRFGKKGSAIRISDVKAELKALRGLSFESCALIEHEIAGR